MVCYRDAVSVSPPSSLMTSLPRISDVFIFMMNSMTRGTVERFRHQTLDTLLITAALRFRQNVDRIAAAMVLAAVGTFWRLTLTLIWNRLVFTAVTGKKGTLSWTQLTQCRAIRSVISISHLYSWWELSVLRMLSRLIKITEMSIVPEKNHTKFCTP